MNKWDERMWWLNKINRIRGMNKMNDDQKLKMTPKIAHQGSKKSKMTPKLSNNQMSESKVT